MRVVAGLNRPWVHFVLLGALLFWVQGRVFPEPRPVIGPLAETRVEALVQQWFSAVGRPPSDKQLVRMIDAELDRDILFQRGIELELHLYDTVIYQRLLRNMHFLGLADGRTDQELYEQALDMRLHLGDEVVKRRIIQVMEQMMLARNPPLPPSETQIAAEFELRKAELRHPPRYTIEHLYFNREREAEVDAIASRIAAEQLTPQQALEYSSPFLPGYRFASQTPDQLARHFGSAFVMNLENAGPEAGTWVGPVRSTYGLHYVFVAELEPARDATLEESRVRLLRDLESRARATALQQSIDELRQDYEVLR
jgi:hypothetical protein